MGLRVLQRTAGLIAVVFALGVSGYLILSGPEYGLLDAIYMTVITLTTVGYGEAIDLSGNPMGRAFTIVVLVVGVGSVLYLFSSLTAFIVEGHLAVLLRGRRMNKKISNLNGHYIVCGAGATGEHIVRELAATRRPFVAVDWDEARLRHLEEDLKMEFPSVAGDATDDDTLRAAGIEHAAGLAACIAADKDNLIVTVSARLLNADLRIVCRCIDDRVGTKIRQAGADAIVSPNTIGGLRIVSELVRPTAVSFLDIMLRDKHEGLRVEDLRITETSALAGTTMGELRQRGLPDVLIVALRRQDGSWVFNPGDEACLSPGTSLIFMAGPIGREHLEATE
jgi:voltage-gated potassium channel